MYSGFLKVLQGRARVHLLCLAAAAAVASASCSIKNEALDAEPKRYIQPPAQEKIPASTNALRVCADPNNLPFSNERGEGFENKIAELIGRDMGRPVEYTWWAQRRGFFRNTLRAGLCDVVIGVPSSFELAATTRPYYRSGYVFVWRRDSALDIESLDDPKLRDLKIGVQMVGDDFTNTPPAHALSNRGMISNITGYTLYGDYKQPNPPARIIDAVARNEVDVAVVWGPLAGYFGSRSKVPREMRPVTPEIDLPYLPFVYDISAGVRRGEDELIKKLDEILIRREAEIAKILDEFHVPRAAKKQGEWQTVP